MSAPRSPAFQFYPHDFLAGRVATYSLEEIGAYITLLGFDWTLNGLPNSVEKLAKICRVSSRRFANIWQTIGDQFPPSEDGTLRNPRLQAEREKQLAYSQSMSENGKRGGRPRKPEESRGLAAAKPDESSPSPSSITTTTKASTRTAAWASRLAVLWSDEVGTITPGRVGKALKDAVHKHGEDRIERAMRAWLAVQKADGRPCTFSWFAQQTEVWVQRTKAPADVVDGEMSDTLELMTRPRASNAKAS
ncbi:MAG TPA: DUF1376 domain-containing protein [Polyangia bacterium]|nr:DUF1376 domain-containing protein [Polyangia bacterium]